MNQQKASDLKFMTLPNFVTLLRPVFAVAAVVFWLHAYYWAGFIFGIFSYGTDFVDGKLARRFGWTTIYGKYLDILTDIIATQVIFITFTVQGLIPLWVTLIIIGRESYINVFRALLNELGSGIPTSQLGRIKTFAIGFSLFFTVLKFLTPSPYMSALSFLFLLAAVVFSLASAADYTIKSIHNLKRLKRNAVETGTAFTSPRE